jgi:small-conductance mechanosensitive channel
LRFIKPFFDEIKKGSLPFPGFYPEWGEPTYRLLKIFIIIIATIVIFPYLPGFGSPAFQNVSLLIGVLVSFGSSGVVSNIVAGIILIYTRAFQIGDRVQLSIHRGDIVEKSLLVTRIRTSKNVLITIPNSNLLNGEIINYSASIRETGRPVVFNTLIALSYDIPWQKVHETLIKAALNSRNILEEPLPFVLQKSLSNSWIIYELNAYSNYPNRMSSIYSELHRNILDECNKANIEIMTSTYSSIRDGNKITIPEEYLDDNNSTGGFQLNPIGNLFQIDLNLAPPRQSNSNNSSS